MLHWCWRQAPAQAMEMQREQLHARVEGERVEPGAGMLCEPSTLHFKAVLLTARATCLGDALHPAQSHE